MKRLANQCSQRELSSWYNAQDSGANQAPDRQHSILSTCTPCSLSQVEREREIPHRKMGVTIQFESHRVELAAIYEMEHDAEVLEYYDQPPPLKLNYDGGSGKRLSIIPTPTFLSSKRTLPRGKSAKPRTICSVGGSQRKSLLPDTQITWAVRRPKSRQLLLVSVSRCAPTALLTITLDETLVPGRLSPRRYPATDHRVRKPF